MTNDSGFITSDNTKIPLSGSSAISGDLIPSTDGTVNLGSPSYQWNHAYIKSLTINGKTPAYDDDVVHKSGDTMSGDLLGNGSNSLGTSTNKWKTINGYDVTGIGHIGSSGVDQSGDTKTYTRINPNGGHYAHYCVAPDNGWVACREHGGSGTFQVCALGSDLESDPIIISPPLDQYQFGSIPVRKGEYYAILSYNESAAYTMRFVCNNG